MLSEEEVAREAVNVLAEPSFAKVCFCVCACVCAMCLVENEGI